MRRADELRALFEAFLDELEFSPALGELAEPVRYALSGGGKRIRPVLCLATGEAAGAAAEDVLPAAAAVELVHTFSLVHDDLPALDDDVLRRGRATTHVAYGEAVAVIAGDALLAEAFRLAASYSAPAVARELAEGAIEMIGGQHLDVTGQRDDEARLHHLKTGSLFRAAVGCALWVAGVPGGEQRAWRAFAGELGLLFQIRDDIADGDGYAERYGAEGAAARAAEATTRARAHLLEIPADTTVLADIVAGVAAPAP